MVDFLFINPRVIPWCFVNNKCSIFEIVAVFTIVPIFPKHKLPCFAVKAKKDISILLQTCSYVDVSRQVKDQRSSEGCKALVGVRGVVQITICWSWQTNKHKVFFSLNISNCNKNTLYKKVLQLLHELSFCRSKPLIKTSKLNSNYISYKKRFNKVIKCLFIIIKLISYVVYKMYLLPTLFLPNLWSSCRSKTLSATTKSNYKHNQDSFFISHT